MARQVSGAPWDAGAGGSHRVPDPSSPCNDALCLSPQNLPHSTGPAQWRLPNHGHWVGSWPSAHRPLARSRRELGCRSPRPEHAVRDGRRVLSPMRGACPQRPCPSSCGARAGLPGRKPEQPQSPAFVHGEPCPPPRVCLPQAWPISAGFSRDRGDAHHVPFLQCWGQN